MTSTKDKVPMELDAMLRARDEDEEYDSDGSDEEVDKALFFMEPDHDKIRSKEDPETQDYWEAGITMDTISALKTGNIDHSQKSCYHCSRKGHIKANCPERKKLGARPWTKCPRHHDKRMTHARDMESEEDEENHSLADQAPPEDDTQGPK